MVTELTAVNVDACCSSPFTEAIIIMGGGDLLTTGCSRRWLFALYFVIQSIAPFKQDGYSIINLLLGDSRN